MWEIDIVNINIEEDDDLIPFGEHGFVTRVSGVICILINKRCLINSLGDLLS